MNVRSRILIPCLSVFLFAGYAEQSVPAQGSRPPAAGASAGRDQSNELSIVVGKSALVDFNKPVIRVAIGLGEVAEATAVSPTEVMVNGKATGNTSLIVWEQGGERQFFNVLVHASRAAAEDTLTSLRRELKLAIPGQNITVVSENSLVFLRGTVNDLASSDRAVQIASGAGKVVNLLNVHVPAMPPQILLKVRFASVDRSLTNQLGLNLFSTGAANTLGVVSTGQFPAPTVSLPSASTGAVATVSNALNLFFFRPDLNLGATIEALESQGLVQTLAEPNVLAEDGKQASFLAGGEYPYPVVQGVTGGVGGAVTITFKEYGVRLNFIPTITPRGTIRLQVAPEVSALDFTNAVTISGFTVPAITVRRVNTEVELNEGQSFAIGGLLDNRETQTFQKIPFIGSVPILGKLFQSISKTRTNTELIVIVTPEVVPPIPVGQPLPQLKFPEKFLPPNSNISMSTPQGSATGANPPLAPPDSIPVGQLIQSLQPERPLIIDGSYSSSSGASTLGGGAPPTLPHPNRRVTEDVLREHSEGPARLVKVWNATRRTELGCRVEIADHGAARRKGLLGRSGLASGEGLWIVPCESVHTFWMKFPIDLVYLDRRKRVKKVRSGMRAWRLSACLSAHSILEFAAGTVKRTQTRAGDVLELSFADIAPGATDPALRTI